MSTRFEGLTLLVPARGDPERDAVGEAWRRGGGRVTALARFWEPPDLDPAGVRVYGNDTFCLVVAQKLGLELLSPPDELLVQLGPDEVGRSIESLPLGQSERLHYPIFIKSAVPKLFTAQIYASAAALDEETRGLEASTLLLASECVEFEAEARSFVLDGQVLSLAAYEGKPSSSELDTARALAARVAQSEHLPRTCVLDVGPIRGRAWALIEANASWGSGLNGCDPDAAARCIAAACRPSERHSIKK